MVNHQPDCVNEYGLVLTATAVALASANPGVGFFVDSCTHHCWYGPQFGLPDGTKPLAAFAAWWAGASVRIVQDGLYPCEACCSVAGPAKDGSELLEAGRLHDDTILA